MAHYTGIKETVIDALVIVLLSLALTIVGFSAAAQGTEAIQKSGYDSQGRGSINCSPIS